MQLKPGSAIAAALIICLAVGAAHAQSSLGIGGSEAPVATGETGILGWIGAQQEAFYKQMKDALIALRGDGSGALLLISLSFAYGVFHAAGPGHGKVIISSYMLANETQLRRGIMLSVLSSAMQAITAIVMVGGIFLFLRGTSISMTQSTRWLELGSYGLIIVFGLWLLATKLRARPTPLLAHQRDHAHDDNQHHAHGVDVVCSSCGHAHMPDAAHVSSITNWREALSVIFAVGLRPCSGAVIVLSFALLNGLYAAGIASVFAMAAGTALTVSILASLAVTAKNTALRFSSTGVMSARLHSVIEIAGASAIVLLGVLMLGGALAT